MSERRYTEDEVAEIFERATDAQKAALPAAREGEGDGLTLAELQAVGREVGLPPELVERAAKSLAMKAQAHDRMMVGLPVGVGRTVELDRPLTDAEWHRLVVDLRETFDARGKLSEQGPFKQWTNGNLQALLEPTTTGQRLRLKTLKGSAVSMMSTGLGMTGLSAAVMVALYLRASPFDAGALWAVFVTGVAMLVTGAFQVPGWARQRKRQMEEIAERLALAVSAPPEDPPTRSPGSS
jgi:hypothetical protein